MEAIQEHERQDNAEGWSAPASPRRVTAIASLLLMGLLGAGAWLATGHHLEAQARQRVADRWDSLRICLLGDAPRHDMRPSEQVRLTRLRVAEAPEGASWPSRCLPHAAALDEAVQARAVHTELAGLPSAAAIIEAEAPGESELDALVDALEAADLPLPVRQREVQLAPPAARPLLHGRDLHPLAEIEDLERVAIAFDPGEGRPRRLLLEAAEGLSLCRLDEALREARCRRVPIEPPPGAKLELVPAPAGAADLVQVRDAGVADGFYDASTGLLVHQTQYFATRAVVDREGAVTLSSARVRGGAVERFERVQIAPGKRPQREKLPLSTAARLVLLPDALLWWQGGAAHDQVYVLAGDAPRPLAQLPRDSRFVARCRASRQDALLTTTGVRSRRYSLLLRAKQRVEVLDVGTLRGRVALSCHGDEVFLRRHREGVVSRFRCRFDGCRREVTGVLGGMQEAPGRIAAAASVGARLVGLWSQPGDALRMRIGAPSALAEQHDRLVFDVPEQSGVQAIALRMVDGGGLALALIQDASLRLHALRIDSAGEVTPLRVTHR